MCVQLISRTRNPGSWKADCTVEAIKLDSSLWSPRSLDCPHPDDLCLYVLGYFGRTAGCEKFENIHRISFFKRETTSNAVCDPDFKKQRVNIKSPHK